MSGTETAAEPQNSVGGRLCLDFINTVDWHISNSPGEYLASYADLVLWSQRVHTLTEEEGQRLLNEAALRPAEAAATLAAAITIREALFRIFLAAIAGKMPSEDDLALFNAARDQALAHSEIAATGDGFAWRWKATQHDLDWMLWPITLSAADLLLSPDLVQVKECPGPGCGWFFLDTSKNHTRRWCTMESCGNRAKFRRHYQRKRQSAQESERS